jgi:recombination protein RecR
LAYFLLESDDHYLQQLATQIANLKSLITTCHLCGSYSEEESCPICQDRSRLPIICVVEKAQDVLTLEQTGEYKGLYHVLGGLLAPLDGVTPDDLNIKSLLERLVGIDEVFIATSLTLEGDATALYLQGLLKNYNLKISRIASGLPVGGDLLYADKQTLGRSIKQRAEL